MFSRVPVLLGTAVCVHTRYGCVRLCLETRMCMQVLVRTNDARGVGVSARVEQSPGYARVYSHGPPPHGAAAAKKKSASGAVCVSPQGSLRNNAGARMQYDPAHRRATHAILVCHHASIARGRTRRIARVIPVTYCYLHFSCKLPDKILRRLRRRERH